MKQLFIWLAIGVALVQHAAGQRITGSVRTTSGDAVPYASISVLNIARGAVTGSEGTYTLLLPYGSYQLVAQAPGYAARSLEVAVAEGEVQADFILSEDLVSLDEIVLTATKQEALSVSAPVAASVLNAEKVVETRTWGLGGLTALVPNYLYQELGVGFQQVQSIRGVQVFSENPAVATYVDDVNSLDILANGFMFTDIERIEVLRGPQGTLFGRNAMGGVVNIVTRQPTNRSEGFAEVGIGNLALQRHSAGFKLPLIRDQLFLGASGLYQGRKGYWINDTTGTGGAEAAAQGRTVGGERNLYGNFYLKWLPSARFSATLNFKAQRDWSDETGFFVSQPSETVAFAAPDQIYLRRVGSHDRRISNTSLVLKYYSPAFTITSISALQRISLSFEDIDFPGFYHSFWESAIGEPLPPQQVLTQEVRISSARRESRLQYTAGVFGFTQKGYEPSTNLAFEVAPDAYSVFRNISNNQGLAVFGELSFRIASRLKASAGLRYDNERRESIFNGFGDASFIAGQFIQTNPDTTVSGSYSALSPKVVLSYAPSAGSSLYLSYTRGFRAGGVNAQKLPSGIRQTFDPEYSDNFELGGKLLTPGGKLSLGAAAFLIRWQDLQFFNLVAPFTYARENVGDARSAGIELEASAIPVKGLQLDASFGYNATQYLDFSLRRVNFATGEELLTPIGGNRLSNAPASTFFLGAQYTLPLPGKLRATLRGEVRRVGEFYTDIQNSLSQPAYTVFNARISVELNQKYSLVFWGQNLNDAVYLAFGTPDTSFGSRSVRTAAPRTLGLTLSVKF